MFTYTVGVANILVNNNSDVLWRHIQWTKTYGSVHAKLLHIDAGVKVNEFVHLTAMVTACAVIEVMCTTKLMKI